MSKGRITSIDLLLGQYINIRRWEFMGANWNKRFWKAQQVSLEERITKLSRDDFNEYIQRTLDWEKRSKARRARVA